ncbi:MAG: fibrillarin-like rRNA/tRNA 2'-O-methyltransferase [Candidatus Thermoplasmatota archaeon]|nr:fibrillarin-like rRNA/tRNA 2'-O-methyltransferase [Candidatus Thermoplasmatota archaeon]
MIEANRLLQLDGRLFTEDLEGGRSVHGEQLMVREGRTFREWVPWRSKMATYIKKKGLPLFAGRSLLYLGAAQGTTVSHLSDLMPNGTIFAVEVSSTAFSPLCALSKRRHNIVPILGDAFHPETYSMMVGSADAIYQDVAQKDQLGMFLRNSEMLLRKGGRGMLMLKARSVDVTADPQSVADRTAIGLKEGGFEVLDVIDLDPFQKDHYALHVERV